MEGFIHVVSNVSFILLFILGLVAFSGLVSPTVKDDPRDEIIRKYLLVV